MKTCAVALLLGMLSISAVSAAEDDSCSANHSWWGSGSGFAQSRQERLPSAAVNYVNPGQNGSVRIHGWNDSDVLVKACIQTQAPSDAEAHDLASHVRITNGAGHIEASGPANRDRYSWSVSYQIWMPVQSETKIEASNGSIAVDGVKGRIRFHTLNGSVRMSDAGGEIEGETTNGSVTVSVAQAGHYGNGLKLETTNGSVKLELPADFSARVEASTVNGSIRTDFPIKVSGEIGKHLSFTLGSGGPAIDTKTVNGSIQITRKT